MVGRLCTMEEAGFLHYKFLCQTHKEEINNPDKQTKSNTHKTNENMKTPKMRYNYIRNMETLNGIDIDFRLHAPR